MILSLTWKVRKWKSSILTMTKHHLQRAKTTLAAFTPSATATPTIPPRDRSIHIIVENRPYRDRNSDYRRPDPRIRRGKLHVDFDSAPTHSLNRGRKADSHHPLIREEGTPFLAAMADTDFKEERDDRRDRGGYRGGNNKRRRDGK